MKSASVTFSKHVSSKSINHLFSKLSFMRKKKRCFIGFIILLCYIGMAVIGPILIPLDLTIKPAMAFMSMSMTHPFGTDKAGRDVFALLVHGSRQILSVALFAGFITILLGTFIGLLSGFKGGKIDNLLMLIADIALTVPEVPLILVLAVFLGYTRAANPITLGAILSITSWASLSRSVRSQVLSLKEREFIEAAKTLGLSSLHIIFREILPHMRYYILINYLYSMTGAIYASIGLFFLGVMPFDVCNWGIILFYAQSSGVIHAEGLLNKGPLIGPILNIILLQIGLVLFVSGLEELFNPRLRTD